MSPARVLHLVVALALGIGALVALPACGKQCPGAINLTVITPAIYRFDKPSYQATAPPGCSLVVHFENQDVQSHSLVFEGADGVSFGRRLLAGGVAKTYSVKAKAGAYTLYCDVPGHREGGQQATLAVG